MTNDREALINDLATQAKITPEEVNVEDIGPTWGQEISRKAIRGLVFVLLFIGIYIAWRFEWSMAAGAMVALVHDVLITAGIYALVGREVTPETVIAILTILGFSLYDTVVIYDKIKENTESAALTARLGYTGVVDMSLNQTVMRSVNTSLVVLLPILSLLLFGGQTLKDFAFAMFIGVATGAYSSIFIAAPVLTIIKERQAAPRPRGAAGAHASHPGADGPRRPPRRPRSPRPMTQLRARRPPRWRAPSPSRSPGTRRVSRPSASGGKRCRSTQIEALIRDVPDFPEPGIVFKDITPVLADPIAFSTIIDLIVVHFGRGNVDKVVGIEARGFILGAPVAYHFGAGIIPVRKKGKLPARPSKSPTRSSTAPRRSRSIADAVQAGERVLVVDDVLATGGTAQAAANLVERVGGKVCGIATLIELDFLHGRDKLQGYDLFTLIHY